MSYNLERQAVETRFADNWTGTSADRIEWENVEFKKPETGAYVRLLIRPGNARQASINTNPLNRYTGVIIVDVFVRPYTGTATATDLADQVAAIFRNAQFSITGSGTITCRVPTAHRVGIRNGWYQISVSTPYYRDKSD